VREKRGKREGTEKESKSDTNNVTSPARRDGWVDYANERSVAKLIYKELYS